MRLAFKIWSRFIYKDTTTATTILNKGFFNLCLVVELSGLFPCKSIVFSLAPEVDEIGDKESWKKPLKVFKDKSFDTCLDPEKRVSGPKSCSNIRF